MTTYVSSSYSLSSIMFSYILAQMHRHCPHPVEQSNPVLLHAETAQSVTSHLTATSHYFQQRFLSNIHVTLHGQDSSLPSTAFQPISFVNADVEQALIPLSILAPEGKRGGYGS